MSDPLTLVLALLTGAVLGACFFGGLWWTVQKGLASETPALWFLGSLVLRTGVTLAAFYFVSQGHWSRLGACLLGFVVARVVIAKWLARTPVEVQPSLEKETSHAPHSR